MTRNASINRGDEVLSVRSDRAFAFFTTWLEGYFARRFTAVRLLGKVPAELPSDKPIVIYTNHPSWWDPLIFMIMQARFFSDRHGFGPMDAAMLRKFGFMRRIGVFGIEAGPRGAANFLKIGRRLLAEPTTVLWLTPQGAFDHSRSRPNQFRPGLAHLARDCAASFLPMAIELTYWNEPKAEVLLHFGEVEVSQPDRTAGANAIARWNSVFERHLTAAQERLAATALTRDPSPFSTLIVGNQENSACL